MLRVSRLPVLEPSLFPPLTPAFFAKAYLAPQRPGHFPSLISSGAYAWPAHTRWSAVENGKETLRGMRAPDAVEQVVKVELSRPGRGYGDGLANGEQWEQLSMPFGTFLDAFICGSIPWADSATPLVGYMAQQPLSELGSTLEADCPPLPHASAGPRGTAEQWGRMLWVGGAETFTPLHRDPYSNFFAQVVGYKRVSMFPPSAAPLLHLYESGTQQNTSRVATEEPLLEGTASHDELSLDEACSHPEAAHVVLEPGDVLYIPQGWLHCVSAVTPSASVNTWFR